MEFDLIASEKNFTVLIAVAAFVVFWAVWTAVTWKPPIEARLKALQTREGNLIFASGDSAEGFRGFIDGAIESGLVASREALRTLRS